MGYNEQVISCRVFTLLAIVKSIEVISVTIASLVLKNTIIIKN